jgi:hypothetical protein
MLRLCKNDLRSGNGTGGRSSGIQNFTDQGTQLHEFSQVERLLKISRRSEPGRLSLIAGGIGRCHYHNRYATAFGALPDSLQNARSSLTRQIEIEQDDMGVGSGFGVIDSFDKINSFFAILGNLEVAVHAVEFQGLPHEQFVCLAVLNEPDVEFFCHLSYCR